MPFRLDAGRGKRVELTIFVMKLVGDTHFDRVAFGGREEEYLDVKDSDGSTMHKLYGKNEKPIKVSSKI